MAPVPVEILRSPPPGARAALDIAGWAAANAGKIAELARPPVGIADLIEFCRELAELDALCKAEGIPWVSVEAAPSAARNGQDRPPRAPGGNGARNRSRSTTVHAGSDYRSYGLTTVQVSDSDGAAGDDRQGVLALVSNADAGSGTEGDTAHHRSITVEHHSITVEHRSDSDSSITPLKRCGGPSHPEPVLVPLREFGRESGKKDGRKAWCRRCCACWLRQQARRRGEEVTSEGKRRCTACGEVKAMSEFGRHSMSPGGRRLTCQACSAPSGWLARPIDQRKAAGYGRVKVRRVSDSDGSGE